jgi:hypothetical protein
MPAAIPSPPVATMLLPAAFEAASKLDMMEIGDLCWEVKGEHENVNDKMTLP